MRILAALFLLALPLCLASAECRRATGELDGMAIRQARLQGPGGASVALEVRVADSGRERAAGFQHVCPETADAISILFLFPAPTVPSFHMRNVHMPLDIAFIDDAGVIRSVQTMQPQILGAREGRLWRPPVPVVAALEVRAGLLEELGVTEHAWSLALVP